MPCFDTADRANAATLARRVCRLVWPNDRYVKYIFANPENKPLLIGLINDALADLPEGVGRGRVRSIPPFR